LEGAIEISRGLLVAGMRAAGQTVFPINPLAMSRYRDRYRSSRGKSDAFDAMVLANILRTGRDAHRLLPADSVPVRALQVLTRAQQDAIWDKLTLTSPIRSLLKMFFPRCNRGDKQIIKIHGSWVCPSGSSSSRWTRRCPGRSRISVGLLCAVIRSTRYATTRVLIGRG
jgi:hypothetical protein